MDTQGVEFPDQTNARNAHFPGDHFCFDDSVGLGEAEARRAGDLEAVIDSYTEFSPVGHAGRGLPRRAPQIPPLDS
jgi:hypothetical protein